MAIALSELMLTLTSGTPVVDGQLAQVLPNGKVGDGPRYAYLEVRNTNATLTLSAVKAWLAVDTRGGTFAIALAVATAQAIGAAWSDPPALTALTYSTPTTQAGGLALPDLPAGFKALIAVRRDLTSATAVSPETNRLYIGGTSPL